MILMGHRGARNEKPENTMAGFQHIANLGLKSVELDIHLSKDEQLIVIHDDSFDRTTDAKGPIHSYTLQEIKEFDAGEGQQVPALAEVLNFLLPLGFEIQIEIKDPRAVAPLISYLKLLSKEALNSLIIISFDHRTILEVKNKIPEIRTTAIIHAYPLDPCSIIEPAKADGLSVNIAFVDNTLIQNLKKRGYLITVWNVNTYEHWKFIKKLNIDYLVTDNPTKVLKWINSES